MKKLFGLILLLLSITVNAQVSTAPTIPTASDAITITFNAVGTGLEGYTGDVYAHTGVLTTNSTSQSDWKHVIGSWGNNATQPKLTRLGANSYELVITPNIASFYGSGSEVVTDIALVFRNSAGNAQTNPDIFIKIYANGLNIALTNPSDEAVFNVNDNVNITAESSINANLNLKVNNSTIQTATNATTISSNYTFTSPGNYTIEAVASQNSETKTDVISVFVKTPTQNESIPPNLENGVNINNNGSVTFVLQAPFKNDVFIIGDFNNWSLNAAYQMKKDNDTFWLTVNGLDADTEFAYQYFIDYSLKVADPYAKKILDPDDDPYIPNTTYPNLKAYPTGLATGNVSTFKINPTPYTWQNTTFTKPNKENLIVYEMLIRDFTENDSFIEAMTHLDYLETLGVNAIELMPISEFEGNDSWGYNPSFHGALDKAYGTQNHFKSFVDACHSRGIAVILDVVYNHAFGQSPLAQMYWDSANNKPATNNPWLNPDAKHPFNVGYDFNHESQYTKTFVKQTLKYWIEEFKVDGFRFDLSKGFTQTNNPSNVGAWSSQDNSRIAILQDYANYIWNNVSTDAYLILEHFANNSEETILANYGFMLWGNLNHSFNQNTMGFSTDADISWLSYQNRGWSNPHIVGYMESHDEERLMVRNIAYGNSNGSYNTKQLSTALDRIEAATAIFYSIPGPKMLWQFGELGYDKSINCESNINDSSCRLDRKPVAWTLGYDTNTNRMDVYNVTAKMINLKKQYPSTFNTDNFSMSVSGLLKRVNLYDNVGNLDAVVIANFNVTAQTINPNFPNTGTWYDAFTETSINVTSPTAGITLQPGEYRLYTQTASLNNSKFELSETVKVYPNPTQNTFSINKNINELHIYTTTGKLVKSFKGNFSKGFAFDISTLPQSIYVVKTNSVLETPQAFKIIKL
ncbi:T9SS type A sorting domain-containing protein [Seonamhaeicola algicola]|uniref:T9SS type A sorting domain-containing protein n=1 Tax=Seonamhaeicola algicola TaxID=1719036 RepID=A0A5C7AMU5_9FLAO|nr:alpha-amylase family glycosyl hydrolase [Seonamhaeicola algicola]TXE09717.1 T9SS type A sorting domain-containing protein [Seonamhaeicola algicola]